MMVVKKGQPTRLTPGEVFLPSFCFTGGWKLGIATDRWYLHTQCTYVPYPLTVYIDPYSSFDLNCDYSYTLVSSPIIHLIHLTLIDFPFQSSIACSNRLDMFSLPASYLQRAKTIPAPVLKRSESTLYKGFAGVSAMPCPILNSRANRYNITR